MQSDSLQGERKQSMVTWALMTSRARQNRKCSSYAVSFRQPNVLAIPSTHKKVFVISS
jgi:hypothetical protein